MSTIFVSYAHAGPEHVARVGTLVGTLRKAGLQVLWDGDVATPQGPPEGWPKWMRNGIKNADWVLVVCDPVNYRRYLGEEADGTGLGARWEWAIIEEALYAAGSRNDKFIPVLIAGATPADIPDPLRRGTYHRLPEELETLIAALQNAAASAPKTPRRVPTRPSLDAPFRRFGPIIVIGLAVLIVAGIFLVPREPATPPPEFPLTVYVHGPGGRSDLPLRNEGAVFLDLNSVRYRAKIREDGDAVFLFPGSAATYRGRAVNLGLDSRQYDIAGSGTFKLDGSALYLPVRRKAVRHAGSVTDENGKAIVGATVRAGGMSTLTVDGGRFELQIPPEAVTADLIIEVEAEGFQTWRHALIPDGALTAAVLRREGEE